jgi:hypothetical protein
LTRTGFIHHVGIALHVPLQPKMPIDAKLEPFNTVVGAWEIETRHPMFPSTVVHGTSEFEWLEGERFLLQSSCTDHSEFPDSLIVFGADEDGLSMNYFDSRGVHRIYQVSLRDGVGGCGGTPRASRRSSTGSSAPMATRSTACGSYPETTRRGPTTSRSRSDADSRPLRKTSVELQGTPRTRARSAA